MLSGPGACGTFLVLEDGMPIRPVGSCNVNELFEVDGNLRSIAALKAALAAKAAKTTGTILLLIGSFQVFTLSYVLTDGGPADSTLFTMHDGERQNTNNSTKNDTDNQPGNRHGTTPIF